MEIEIGGNPPMTFEDTTNDVNRSTRASEATLAALNAKVPALVGGNLPVSIQGASVTLNVDDTSISVSNFPATYPVTDNGGSLTVDGTVAVSGVAGSVAVTGTFWQATQPVSGTVTANAGTGTFAVSGTFWQATQPVSAASLPLPTGAATETTLAAQSAKLPATLGQKTMANALAVSVASDQSNLPSNLSQVAGATVATGNGTASGSLRVSIASDNTAFSVKQGGKAKADLARNDHTSTAVTTGAYVQLVASLAAACSEVEIFDSSGQSLFLAVGAAASEVNQLYIFPGGNGRVPLAIAASSRVSVKAVSGATSAGELLLNFYA